jgi:predicted lactoylglutathione lyase
MLAFKAGSKADVEAAHKAGLANGGCDEGAPGFRPPEKQSFYGAYLRDPTGNKIALFWTP